MKNPDKDAKHDTRPGKSSKPMDDASNSRESNKPDNKTARQNDQGN